MSIKTDAVVIRDETTTGANTAVRVGTNLVDIADDLVAKQAAIDLKQDKPSEGAFVDGDKTKLDGITAGATPDQVLPTSGVDFDPVGTDNSDDNAVNTLYSGLATSKQDDLDVVSQVDAEAGTATDERIWTAQRVKQAIDALGGSGGVDSIVAGTNVTVDATDPSNPIVSSSGGGGASNPNIKAVTDQASLVAALTGTQKELSIQADFTLTSNITIPANAKITYGGGVIDASTFIVTFVNNDLADSKWNFLTATIDDASTFSVGNINICDFGLVPDGDVDAGTGTDNRNVFLQAQKIYNKTGDIGTIDGVEGVNMLSLIPSVNYGTENLYITGDARLYLESGNDIGVLPNNFEYYDVITAWKSTNGWIKGKGKLWGDLKNHIFDTGVDEHCFGIRYIECDGIEIGIELEGFPADCLTPNYDAGFYYLDGVTQGTSTEDFTIGASGTAIAEVGKNYSNRFDVTNQFFQDRGATLSGGSFSGFFGLDIQRYKMIFYDNTSIDGDTTTGYISQTGEVDTYKMIPLPPNTSHIRVEYYTPSVWGSFSGSIVCPSHSDGAIISCPKISYGKRNGMSNIEPNTTIKGVRFEKNGQDYVGNEGGVRAHIDNEDGYQRLNQVKMYENTFINATGGDITLIGSTDTRIYNNKFLYNTDPNFVGGGLDLHRNTRGAFYDNFVQGRRITMGRALDVYNNTAANSTYVFFQGDETLHDSYNNLNTRFQISTVDVQGKSAYMKNVFGEYDILNDTDAVFKSISGLKIENVELDFKGLTFNNATNLLSTGTGSDGFIKGLKILNISSESKHSVGFRVGTTDIDDLTLPNSCGLQIGFNGTTMRDQIIKNCTLGSWLHYDTLNGYTSTGAGIVNTLNVIDTNITVSNFEDIRYGLAPSYIIYTAAKDTNFYMEGGSVNMMIGTLGEDDKFINLLHLGTTTFKNVKFTSNSVSSTFSTTSSTNPITFIDCDFTDLTVVSSAGDLFKYTTPNTNCPSYVDNATALAALGEGYYYKDTTTGKFEVTIA